jgi:hypothetical protein
MSFPIQEDFPELGPGKSRRIRLEGNKHMKTTTNINYTALALFALCWFALSPALKAGCPSPPGGCGGQNTAVGDNALFNVTSGVWNVGVGFQALFNDTTGNQNTAIGYQGLFSNVSGDHATAIGAQALFNNTIGNDNVGVGFRTLYTNTSGNRNTGMGFRTLAFNASGNNNTAVGWNALYNNTTGDTNIAVGSQALFDNTTGVNNNAFGVMALADNNGDFNNAHGRIALLNNTTGFENNAMGDRALRDNVSGFQNTALGDDALLLNTGSSHTCVGKNAGNGITTVDNNIIIGHLSGVHSRFGQVSDRCFIDNIYGAPVDNSGGIARIVYVDPDGRLGTTLVAVAGTDTGGFFPLPAPRQTAPETEKEATLNLKVEKLQATVGQQQKQIETLTTQLREQAAQIQKVSAQLEVSKPAPRTVLNNP